MPYSPGNIQISFLVHMNFFAMCNERLPGYRRTRKHCFDVPGSDGVNEGVHIKHHYRDGEAVGVSFHRADVDVVPLDPQALLFILRKVLAAEAEGHG